MIYITIGLDARNLYIDKLIKKTDKNILKFDENSLNEFLNEINNQSLFSMPSLIILKGAEKIKNISKILESLSLYNENDIIIDFNTNKISKDIQKQIKKFTVFEVLDENTNKKILQEFIQKKLNSKGKDIQNLIDIIGYNYFSIKNETEKILNYLNGENYTFENAKNIISKNVNFFIFNLTDDILSKKNISFPIKEHIAVFYNLINDLEIIYKLHCLNLEYTNYNEFKNKIPNIFILNKYSPYYVYKKFQYMDNFSKDKILKLLDLAFETENKIKKGLINLEEAIELFILNIIK